MKVGESVFELKVLLILLSQSRCVENYMIYHYRTLLIHSLAFGRKRHSPHIVIHLVIDALIFVEQ